MCIWRNLTCIPRTYKNNNEERRRCGDTSHDRGDADAAYHSQSNEVSNTCLLQTQ